MKQLNVLYILTKLELGGAQKVCLTLHQGLVHDNHNAMLISGTEGVLVEEAKKTPGCILLDSFKRELSIRGIAQELKTFFGLIRLMHRYKAQFPNIIVHTHSTKAGILGRWAALLAGIKHRVHTIHGFGFHDFQSWPEWVLFVALEWVTTLITTQIICVSHKDQVLGSKLLLGFAKKSLIIRAAVDDNHFIEPARKLSPSRTKITIGAISCFKPQKNLFDLLEAFAVVHRAHPQTTLEIVGDGTQRTAIEWWIKDHNLQNVITLHGWQSNVQKFLHSWDIFTLSSLWEGLPCSVIEARLARLAVVAYDVGGIGEVVQNNLNGYLVTAGDKFALAQHLQNLIEDPQLLNRLQNHVQDLSSFSARSMVTQHESLYTKLEFAR